MSEPKSEPVIQRANGPQIPTSSSCCYFFANIGLWGGMLVILLSLISKEPEAAVIALSAVSSSLPLFAIAAHLRQQAVTNHLLEKIANKN